MENKPDPQQPQPTSFPEPQLSQPHEPKSAEFRDTQEGQSKINPKSTPLSKRLLFIIALLLIIVIVGFLLLQQPYFSFGQKSLSAGPIETSLSPNSGDITRKPSPSTAPELVQAGQEQTKIPQISYDISYFDIDSAQTKQFVKTGEIDSSKQHLIEQQLRDMKVDPDFIEQFAIAFFIGNAKPGEVIGIFWNNKQTVLSPISSGEEGVAHYEGRYIILRSSVVGENLRSTFTHEVGHQVAEMLSPDEMREFMIMRNIPSNIVNSWYEYLKREEVGDAPLEVGNWVASPKEDFAEVFKTVFGSEQDTGVWGILTKYGEVTPEQKTWFIENISPKFQI